MSDTPTAREQTGLVVRRCARPRCGHISAVHADLTGHCLKIGCDCDASVAGDDIRDEYLTHSARELLEFPSPPRLLGTQAYALHEAFAGVEATIHNAGWDNPHLPELFAVTVGTGDAGIPGITAGCMWVPHEMWNEGGQHGGDVLAAISILADRALLRPAEDASARAECAAILLAYEGILKHGDQAGTEYRALGATDIDGRSYSIVRVRGSDDVRSDLVLPSERAAHVAANPDTAIALAGDRLTDFMTRVIAPAWAAS